MKFSIAFLSLVAAPAVAYQVGGPFDVFGRPYLVSPRGRTRFGKDFRRRRRFCDNNDCVDKAFEDLAKELNDDRARRRADKFNKYWKNNMEVDEETIRQQEEWVSRAFGLANDVAKGMATTPREAEEAQEAIRQSKEFVDSIFGFAQDVSSGRPYTPVRSEIVQDDDESFEVSIDLPGVKLEDIDVVVEGAKEKLLVVRGKRDLRNQNEGEDGTVPTKEFRKVFALDSTSVIDKISVVLENGVLSVTVPKDAALKAESTTKIPVVKVADDEKDTSPAKDQTFDLELDVPGVAAANIDITVEGDSADKTLTITAVRELGTDKDGSPKKREISKRFKVDEIVDTDKLVATLTNGVLRVTAPADEKRKEDFIKKIDVTDGSMENEATVDVKAPEPEDEGDASE